MQNQVVIQVEGMRGSECEDKIVHEIAMTPGVEFVQANAKKGLVAVTGGDLDLLNLVDIIESMGYSALI